MKFCDYLDRASKDPVTAQKVCAMIEESLFQGLDGWTWRQKLAITRYQKDLAIGLDVLEEE